MTELFDVVAVNIKTHEHRLIAEAVTEANADGTIRVAVMLLGVEDEFFKAVPHGDNDGIELIP